MAKSSHRAADHAPAGRARRIRSNAVIHTPLVFFMDVVLVFLALAGTVYSLVTGFELLSDMTLTLLLPICLLLTLLTCIVQALPGVEFLALAVLCQGVSVVVRFQWDTVLQGVEAMITKIVNTMADQIEGIGYLTPSATLTASAWAQSVSLVLFLGAALLALYLGWAVVRRRSAFLTFLPTLALTLPALLAEQWPWWPAFMALTACWITMFLCSLSSRNAPEASARLSAVTLPVAAALLALLSLLLPQKGYQQPQWAVSAYGTLVDLGERLTASYERDGLSGLLPTLTAGSTDTADLGGAGPRSYSGRTMLEVTADSPQRLYLRGVSLGNYENGRWTPLPDEAYDTMPVQLELDGPGQPLLYPAYTAIPEPSSSASPPVPNSVTVQNVRAPGRYVYAPYGLMPDTLPENAVFYLDTGLRSENGGRLHTLDFLPRTLYAGMGPLPTQTFQQETAYRAFVYQNYLTVPSGFLDSIGPWREAAYQAGSGISVNVSDVPYQYETALRTAYGWVALLAATTKYDLDVAAAPRDQDPVAYFLNESRRGYCMYYATAATLLLRANGIPARYVSGFVSDVGNGVTQVPDSSAHAWTEIYLDGYGWYPIEATPAAGVTSTATPPEPAAPKPKPQNKPETPPDAPETPPEETPTQPDAPQGTTGQSAKKAKPLPLWALLSGMAVLAVGAVVTRRELRRRRRTQRMAPDDPNGAVIAAYGWLVALAPFGAQSTEEVEELARKAKFSQHTLSAAECEAVLTHVRQETLRVDRSLPWYRRFLLRYWHGLY